MMAQKSIKQFVYSSEFMNCFIKLADKASAVNAVMREALRDPEMFSEKIRGAGERDFRMICVDDEISVIAKMHANAPVCVFLFLGKTEDAVRWAQTHRCRLNPNTRALQVYPIPHEEIGGGNEEIGEEKKKDDDTLFDTFKEMNPHCQSADSKERKVGALFASVSDESLLKLGVPQDLLSKVRSFESADDLEKAKESTPADAYDSLRALADGKTVEEAAALFSRDTDEEEVGSDKEESNLREKRAFKVVEPDVFLEKISKEALDVWRIFLHPAQRKLVERKSMAPCLVRGSAGTGKTVVALYRVEELAKRLNEDEHNDKRILLTTFTANLASDLSRQLDQICSKEERAIVDVVNIDAFVAGFLKKNDADSKIVYPGSAEYEAAWDKALLKRGDDPDLTSEFYETEWRRVVLGQDVQSEKEYLRARRKGRGSSLTKSQREEAWLVFEEMRNALSRHHLLTFEDACSLATSLVKYSRGLSPYAAVVVDETQDMTAQALEFLAELVKPTEDAEPAIFLVGDSHQRIYSRQASLSSCGINVRGRRSFRLKTVYRTTEEIRKFSESVLLNEEFDNMDGAPETDEALAGNFAVRHGLAPEFYEAKSVSDEADWILAELAKSDCDPKEACVVFRTNLLLEKFKKELDARNVEYVEIKRKEKSKADGLRLATMHRIKGLEFKVIFIADCNEGVIPLDAALNVEDEKERAFAERTERSLFYVASTRARDRLLMSSVGEPSAYLKGLTEK